MNYSPENVRFKGGVLSCDLSSFLCMFLCMLCGLDSLISFNEDKGQKIQSMMLILKIHRGAIRKMNLAFLT